MILLTREFIQAVATEEARRAGADLGDVLGMAYGRRSRNAREAAMIRILDETGCSKSALARLWGCDRQLPGRYQRGNRRGKVVTPKPPPAPALAIYDRMTRLRLLSRHGEQRAVQIMAGLDPQTQADIAAWRGLGARA